LQAQKKPWEICLTAKGFAREGASRKEVALGVEKILPEKKK